MKRNSKTITPKAKSINLKSVPDNEILVEAAMRRGVPLSALIKPTSPSPMKVELRNWKDAEMAARNVDNPNRNPMYVVYDNIQIDGSLSANIETRILKVQQSKFNLVDKNKKINEDAKALFERQWFLDFINYSMLSRFESHSLLEIFEFREDGELAKCDRVNKYHVNPVKGFVTVEPGDDNGVDYLSGNQSLYYIPVGNPDNLGLLFKAAPYILAKKYAIGHWGEFNEKMGIPFRTVRSNSTDLKRQQQLAVIMENMGSAGWAVLNEDEKVELMSIAGTDPTRCFEALINLLDQQVAMLILGQSSTTNSQNNKGTYGSMKILQEISKDRHQADLTFLKYLINDILIPRLIQLSPVYSVLKDLKLEWDLSEDLSVAEVVDYVVKLETSFDIDPDFVTAKTGIPILGRKASAGSTPPDATAKKKSIDLRIKSLYGVKCCNAEALNSPSAASTPSFLKTVLKVAKALHEGRQKGIIDKDMLKQTAEHLQKAIMSGFGTSLEDENIDPTNKEMLISLQKNVFVFSGFKTYQQLRAISDKLIGDDGKARSWSSFKKEVIKLDGEYNVQYLKAEYDLAMVSAQSCSQWIDIQKTKDTLPFLQFDATQDNRTTEICKGLDGIILPVDDPFWDSHFLPLHWGERSVIRQLASGKTSDMSKITLPDLKPMFQNNVGKTGVAFPESHPYFKASSSDAKKVREIVNKVYPDPEDYKKVYTGKKGGFVSVHSSHNAKEVKNNIAVGKFLADKGNEIMLLDYVEGRKNPDALINNKVADFKSIETPTKSALQNCIKSAAAQKVAIAVVSIPKDLSNDNIVHALYASLFDIKRNKTINEVWFLKGKKLFITKRVDVISKKLKKVL